MSYYQAYLSSGSNGYTTKDHTVTYIPKGKETLFSMKFEKGNPYSSYQSYIYERGFEVVYLEKGDLAEPWRVTEAILKKRTAAAVMSSGSGSSSGVNFIPLNGPLQQF